MFSPDIQPVGTLVCATGTLRYKPGASAMNGEQGSTIGVPGP